MSEEVKGTANVTTKDKDAGTTTRFMVTISGERGVAGCIEELLQQFKRTARERCRVMVVIRKITGTGAKKKTKKKAKKKAASRR